MVIPRLVLLVVWAVGCELQKPDTEATEPSPLGGATELDEGAAGSGEDGNGLEEDDDAGIETDDGPEDDSGQQDTAGKQEDPGQEDGPVDEDDDDDQTGSDTDPGGEPGSGEEDSGTSPSSAETGKAIDMVFGWAGVGLVDLSGESVGSYSGVEWEYNLTVPDWDNLCTAVYTMSASALLDDCDGCEWAFSMEASDSVVEGPYCEAWDYADGIFDGVEYAYGYTEDYTYGGVAYGPALLYQVSGYPGWYWVTDLVDWEPTTGAFEFDWPLSYFTYYAYP